MANLILPFYPSLGNLIRPALISHLLNSHVPGVGRRPPGAPGVPAQATALAFVLAAAGLLLATITGLAFAASRRVLGPVRRLARAAQQMSGGDLSVRVEPAGRDELAQLVTTFNTMASALQDKVGELEQMEARARRFAGDVSHELRTPLTAMTAVATARALGMTATRYTDPSGLAASTVSSAADQVILGTATMHQPALAAIAAMRSAVIPVAGLVRNLNTLLGQNGIAGLKTGSDSAAGGCVLLASWRDVRGGGSRVLIVAAVLGQPGTDETILPNALGAGRHLMLGLGQALQPGSRRRPHHNR